jgi:nitric oxide reductase large subunit
MRKRACSQWIHTNVAERPAAQALLVILAQVCVGVAQLAGLQNSDRQNLFGHLGRDALLQQFLLQLLILQWYLDWKSLNLLLRKTNSK